MANSRKTQAKKAAKMAKRHPKIAVAVVIILVIIIAAIAILYYFKPSLFKGLFGGKDDQNPNIPAGQLSEITSAELSIHFLELGNANAGDCTLIKCGNTEVLIDAGSKRNSTQTVKNYINQYCTDGTLEYVIATHAHEDHIAALAGEENAQNGVLYSYTIGTIIQFSQHKTTSKIYNDYAAAVDNAAGKGATVYTAAQCCSQNDPAPATFYLNESKTISLSVLYQEYYEKPASSGENNYSVCTLLTQQLENSKTNNYLFTGDLEKEGEKSLVKNNNLPKCNLFKGGHHGSSTSSNEELLSVIRPDAIAICTCAGTYEYANKPSESFPESQARNSTFPTKAALERMLKYTQNIYVTSYGVLNADYSTAEKRPLNGDIVFYYLGGELKLWCSNNTTPLPQTEWYAQNRQ